MGVQLALRDNPNREIIHPHAFCLPDRDGLRRKQ